MLSSMTTWAREDLKQPVRSREDLVGYLAGGARPEDQWAIGTEMEKLVVDLRGEAAPYSDIEVLLRGLEESGGWAGLREMGHLVALSGEASSITLEPGGQLELSGELCPDLHCSHADFQRHIAQVLREAEPLGLHFLGLGVQPFTPVDRIDWLPKERYRIMGPYMARVGSMGQHMMKMSAGLQVNFDFSDESDCIEKLRIAFALAPLQYALFANSPLMEGRPTGCLSTRGLIWSRTDPDRTGFIPALFQDGAGYDTYVEYALDVPMYFIVRGGRFLDLTAERRTFRRFLEEGLEGHRAEMGDWDLHLSTLFPEVRLRPQIETRSADSLPRHLTLGVGALVKGLLYDAQARDEIRTALGTWRVEELEDICRSSWRLGLKTPVKGRTLRDVALDALAIAQRGLRRQQARRGSGLDEAVFLEGLWEIAESGSTLAERLLSRWSGGREDKIRVLLDHCGFEP